MQDAPEYGRSEMLEPIRETALFYPCCGSDLMVPIRLFSSVISDFYLVDVRRPPQPDLSEFATVRPERGSDRFVTEFTHQLTGHPFRLHRRQQDAQAILHELPPLGVFFFRGDNPVCGEGSSGVLWLGDALFSRVLTLLVPGGFVITDGSSPGPNGPKHLSDFYHDRQVGPSAVSRSVPFRYRGRTFSCVGYAGERYGPTLVWHVQ